MSDRVPHDHDSVHTVDATLVRAGRTDRPQVAVPPAEADRFPEGMVRLVLDGTERFTGVTPALTGDRVELRGAYGTADAARGAADGTDHLPAWRAAHGVAFDATVHVDVVDAGYRYGLRAPGQRQLYDAGSGDGGLQDLAKDLLG